VTGIERAGGRVSGVVVDGTVFACDAVVIAAGPWTGAASAWLDVPLPVEPLKGEILRMQMPGRPLSFDVVAPGISLFARPDGQVWLASTQERAGFDTSPTEAGYQQLYGNAVALMPAVKDATLIQQTVCLRPLSPDDLPILGPVPGVEGAYVATGGGTKGILLAPAMGRAVSDLIVKGSTTVPIAACDPARFTEG
jgi:glycine/D-amino acid oxidase-like deaminating enzyme